MIRHWVLTKPGGEVSAIVSGNQLPPGATELTKAEFRAAPRDLVAENGVLKYTLSGKTFTAKSPEAILPLDDLKDIRKDQIDKNVRGKMRSTQDQVDRHRDEVDRGVTTTLTTAQFRALLTARLAIRTNAENKKTAIDLENDRSNVEDFDTSV